MSLWKLCVIMACAFPHTYQSPSQWPELLDMVEWRAKDTLNDAAKNDWVILEFPLNAGTCYTNRNIPCIRPATTRANRSSLDDIIESYTDTVPFNNSSTPHKKTDKRIRGRSFAGLLLTESDSNSVRAQGVLLEDVLVQYYRRGSFLQAYVRMMNAYESAAIGFIHRFCELMMIAFEKQLTVNARLLEEYDNYMMVTLPDRLTYHFICNMPVREISRALADLKYKSDGEELFGQQCEKNSHRYGNMVGYVQLYEYSDDLDTSEEINEELERNIKAVVNIFGTRKTSD